MRSLCHRIKVYYIICRFCAVNEAGLGAWPQVTSSTWFTGSVGWAGTLHNTVGWPFSNLGTASLYYITDNTVHLCVYWVWAQQTSWPMCVLGCAVPAIWPIRHFRAWVIASGNTNSKFSTNNNWTELCIRISNTLCSKKSDAKIQITTTTSNLIRIKRPLSSFNYCLSGTNVANFNKIHRTVSEQQPFKKWNSKTEVSNLENTN